MRHLFLFLWVQIFLIHLLFAATNDGEKVGASGDPNIAQRPSNGTLPEASGGHIENSPGEGGSGDENVPPEEMNEGSAEGPIPPGKNDESGNPPLIEIGTGIPEESTMPPKEPSEVIEDSDTEEPILILSTPFDINNMETGSPEGSTKEPYMPKPKPKPSENGSYSDSSDRPFTEDYVSGYPEGPTELPLESIAPEHWRSTTTKRFDFTVSQKIDETSSGYKQLLHMLEDLDTRRKEDQTGSNQTEYYMDRATVSLDLIDSSLANTALNNITVAQEYIKKLLADSSLSVRQCYSEIISLTSTPSFYYIPKRQRFLMVNQIISDMGSSGEQEMMSLNTKAKTFCKNSNVDTPPYTLGNIVGNKLGNGAILTK